MDRLIGELFGRAIIELVSLGIRAALQSHVNQNASRNVTSSGRQQIKTLNLTTLSPIQHERAVLIAASTITFGNDCERLVNIAFQTSQAFPTIMGKYADVSEYLCKELTKHYPDECFHIIIGENHGFGFSLDDGQYFAEIEQERYRVVIFTTKQCPHTKSDTHDANSQMSFVWN